MNEFILIFSSILVLYFISFFISKLKFPLQSYLKLLSAGLLIIFVWVIPTENSNIWPRILISILSSFSLMQELKKFNTEKKYNQIINILPVF